MVVPGAMGSYLADEDLNKLLWLPDAGISNWIHNIKNLLSKLQNPNTKAVAVAISDDAYLSGKRLWARGIVYKLAEAGYGSFFPILYPFDDFLSGTYGDPESALWPSVYAFDIPLVWLSKPYSNERLFLFPYDGNRSYKKR